MARYSVIGQLSPAGTVVPVGTSFSNPINTESARDARLLVEVSAIGAGGSLVATVQLSPDGTVWFDSSAFAAITATGNYLLLLEEHQLSEFLRLKYVEAVDTITLKASIEKKHGV